MSRPKPSSGGQFGVATWSFEVATGAGCLGVSRPAHAQHAHDMRTLCERPAHAVCTQCTRPDLVQCTVQVTFMDTVHDHCSRGKKKKSTKNFKNFLVCNLIYEIFILHLL